MFYLKNKHLTFAEMQHTLDYYIFHLLMHNNKIIHVKKTIGKFKSQQERKNKKICFHVYIYHHKYMPTKNTLHIVYTYIMGTCFPDLCMIILCRIYKYSC